jgi:hypothetical protein
LSSILSGTNTKTDEETLLKYVAFEYGYHQNSYSTINNKLYAIRHFTMNAGYEDPLLGKRKLKRVRDGLKKLRGAAKRKRPVTVRLLKSLSRATTGRGYLPTALRTAAIVGFFFLLRISEFAAHDAQHPSKFILRRCDVKFFKNGLEVTCWDIPDEVQLYIRGSKTDSKMQGCYRSHFCSGGELCPVRALVLWMRLTDGKTAPLDPLFSVPTKRSATTGIYTTRILTRQQVAAVLKKHARFDGLSERDVSTHSLRIGGATALVQAGAEFAAVQIVGRWASDVFKIYTRYHKGIMVGVASDMEGVSNRPAQAGG